ncbi:uncharacterized protein LOC131217238 [Magnolia sinica]|uniref:uncharacterized protein LOC131217238 n=1 Tax=Magnolia sinica TaxID=86752 RepID=UPI00265B0E8A|nr:uncharacterized protein LOC131217238 [Magnolia sinica]
MLSKSFKAGKCKTSLKLAIARIKLLKNKRDAQLKQMKRDLAHLLESGQEKTAMIRVEHVVREEKTMAAYDIVELYCELIVARLPIIESQKNCPIDLKEAISSVIFASPRCADIPELQDARKHFTAKYGKEFITSALELRPDCGVNRTIIEKLSAKTPDGETKIKILTAVAQEHNVKWDREALEEQVLKPSEDLLKGPSKFVSASTMHVESPNVQFQPPASQKHEPATTSVENDITRSSLSSTPLSSTSMSTPPSIPTTHPEPNRRGGVEQRHPFYKDENAYSNRQSWNMEFKDATSAAQAAAESAERASIAARAAAEMSRGNFTREYTTESQGPSFYGSRDEGHRRTGSKLKGEHVEHSVRMEDDLPSGSYGRSSQRTLSKQGSEMEDHRPLGAAESRYLGHGSVERRGDQSASSRSSVTAIHELAASHQKADEFSRNSSSEIESIKQNWQSKNIEKGDFFRESSVNKQPSRSASSHSSMGSFDDDISVENLQEEGFSHEGFTEPESVNPSQQSKETEKGDPLGMGSLWKPGRSSFSHSSTSPIDDDAIWVTNVRKHADDAEHSSVSMGQGNAQIGSEQPGVSDYCAAVFDDSGSDSDSRLELDSHSDRREHDSHFLPQGRKSPSHVSSNTDPWSPKQTGSESLLKDSFSTQLHFGTETHPSATFSEGIAKTTVPSQSDDLFPATFNDSDDPASENEEGDDFKLRGQMAQSSHGPADSSLYKKNEATGSNRKTWSHAASDDFELEEAHSEINQKAELNIAAEYHPSGKHTKSPRKYDLVMEPFNNSMVEEQHPVQSSRIPSSKEVGTQEKFGAPTLLASSNNLGLSNNSSNESGSELNLGGLMGGFRNKGYSRPPYIRGRSGDDSLPSKQSTMDETPTIVETPADFRTEKASASSKANNHELYNQKPRANILKESASSARTFFDSDSDDAEERQLHRPVGSSGYRGGMLSRRTKDSPRQSETASPSRLMRRSEVSTSSAFGVGSRSSPLSSSMAEPLSKPQIKTSRPSSSTAQPSKQLPQIEISESRDSAKSSQPSSAVEQPSKLALKTVISGSNEIPKLSSLTVRSTSRENSQKSASHVHPKLPDYDSLAAHLESLRSDRRSE